MLPVVRVYVFALILIVVIDVEASCDVTLVKTYFFPIIPILYAFEIVINVYQKCLTF